MTMTVAAPARPAKKPSDTQLHILRRMAVDRWKIAASEYLVDPHGTHRKRVNMRTLKSLMDGGWIERDGNGNSWGITDAGRQAAQ